MQRLRLVSAAFAACLLAPCAHAQEAAPAVGGVGEDIRLRWLDPVIFAPTHAFAPPPARNSEIERVEFARLRELIRAAGPERLARAAWDGDHEEPVIYNEAAGRDFTKLPATSALLATISAEVDRMVHAAKAWFKRPRPYQADPTLPHCGKGSAAPSSYPSGHAGYGWSVGWTLARLVPERAPQILARAQDFALSRELCGVHFASDIEASHAAAIAAVEQLLIDPRLAPQVAAARAELAGH
ncbi:phosphatase PAP2 family protein [Novosphingobium flavum]|uniref:Acid phosphatase n=1 Tax=Novosphingobium flavum TaxID=1778672 RepID=A0A7X1FS32_9SPHN|nr:phosphatase PAP2 family protein [Novosphingobium flavum]MBC2665332.1 phosphatase PAP2 family protein [Novosphingobium flavum]